MKIVQSLFKAYSNYIDIDYTFMKGFGFPTSTNNGGNAPYRADTSQKKAELINVLTRS